MLKTRPLNLYVEDRLIFKILQFSCRIFKYTNFKWVNVCSFACNGAREGVYVVLFLQGPSYRGPLLMLIKPLTSYWSEEESLCRRMSTKCMYTTSTARQHQERLSVCPVQYKTHKNIAKIQIQLSIFNSANRDNNHLSQFPITTAQCHHSIRV